MEVDRDGLVLSLELFLEVMVLLDHEIFVEVDIVGVLLLIHCTLPDII